MHLATPEFLELVNCRSGRWIRGRADDEGNERFLEIQAQHFSAQNLFLEMRQRLDDRWLQKVDHVGELRQSFDGIEDQSGGGVHEHGVFAGNDRSVMQLYRGSAEYAFISFPEFFCCGSRGCNGCHVLGFGSQLIHQQLRSLHGFLVGQPQSVFTRIAKIPADNLLRGSDPNHRVIDNAEAGTVDTHVRW